MELVLFIFFLIQLVDAQKYYCSDGGKRLFSCQWECGKGSHQVKRLMCNDGKVCCRKSTNNVYRPIRATLPPKGRPFPPVSTAAPRDWIREVYTVQTKQESSQEPLVINLIENIKDQPGARSAKYCNEYSKLSKEFFEATPLLLKSRPFKIEVENCRPRYNPLIVGGKRVTQGEFPHMAAIGFLRNDEIDYLCGGSLISDRFVLTAAHCSNTRWGPPVVVHLGSVELYSENATVQKVESVVIHPDYKPPSVYNDIALVKLVTGLHMGMDLRPACLPAPMTKAQAPGALTIATGWGKLGFGRESSFELMKVSLKVMHNSKCKELYATDITTSSLNKGILPSMLCAHGYKSKQHDTCQGDSGGPLQSVVPGSECMMEVVGITSFGKSCGTGIPGVYTRVASYLPWIEDIVWPDA